MGSDRNKIEPMHAWAFGANFLFQFEHVIRNPGDKELKYIFNFFRFGGVDNTRWKKVQSDPMLIFVSGNRPLQTNTMI